MAKATADNLPEVLSAIRNTRRGARLVYWRNSGGNLQLADCNITNTNVQAMLARHPERLIGVYSNGSDARIPLPTKAQLVEDVNASLQEMPA